MDSSNLSQQDQLTMSSLGTPSLHGVANNHLWNHNFTLNSDNSSESSTQALKMVPPCFNGGLIQPSPTLGYDIDSSKIQDLGFNWSSSNNSNHELQFSKIKQEYEHSSFPNYGGMVSDPSYLEGLSSPGYIKHEHGFQYLNEKLLLRSFSSDCQISGVHRDVYSTGYQSPDSFGGVATCSSGWRSHDFTSVNMQALDLFDSAKFGGVLSNQSQTLFREGGCFGLNLHEQNHGLPNTHQKMPSLTNEAPETKRANSGSVPKTFETPHKKPRYDHSSSFPPFKVKKEKLGDRITTLQQLVAPFGKTDTASVLLEAIGYIKFLQDQVQTLSVPYMNSSPDNSTRTAQGVCIKGSSSSKEKKERDEFKRDLRSRGLCLVPLSCTSHVTNDFGGGVWPPSNFGGGT